MSTDFSFGVEYTPKIKPQDLLAISNLKKNGIDRVRIQWNDLTNTMRFRVVTLQYFEKLMHSSRPGVAFAKAAMGLVYLNVAEGFSAMGEFHYAIDLSTLRICPYAPGHASVFGWVQEKGPVLGPDGQLTVDVNLCPRSLLHKVVKQAKEESGVEFLVGYEVEFILLKSTRPVEANNLHHWSASAGLRSGSIEAVILDEIVDCLQTSGIEVQMYHPEAAPGQYEVITGPLPPLEAADALLHTQETIRNVASKHGLHATFAPRVFNFTAGSGAHANISVHAPGVTKIKDEMSTLESSFLATLLDNLPAITAITLPTPPSFKRVGDGVWSGGTYACWGSENREAPVRLVNRSSPQSRRFEMRFIDATSNPHVNLAAILGVGYQGIKNKQELKIRDCLGPRSAAMMDSQERLQHGITLRLPLTWEEARSNLASSKTLENLFEKEFVQTFLAVQKVLGAQLEQDEDPDATLSRVVEFY